MTFSVQRYIKLYEFGHLLPYFLYIGETKNRQNLSGGFLQRLGGGVVVTGQGVGGGFVKRGENQKFIHKSFG